MHVLLESARVRPENDPVFYCRDNDLACGHTRACESVNARIDARRLANERTIDAKPGSAPLLTGILFEHIDRQSSASEADARCESR